MTSPRPNTGLVSLVTSWACALFLLVLGARLWVFSYAGSPLPLYDQWIAEFNNLFLQAMGGGGVLETLITPHNEHLLLTAKLVSLVGFAANGYWDVPFLAAASAFVRAAEAAVFFNLITQGASPRAKLCIWGACAAVFAAPLSGYNLLGGLQISFYFGGLTLLWSVWVVQRWRSPWGSGALLLLAMIAGLFSIASALAIPAATLATHLGTGQRHKGFWWAWGGTVAAACGYIAIFIENSGSTGHAPTGLARLSFFLQLVSWPLSIPACGAFLLGFLAFALIRLGKRGCERAPSYPAIVGLGVFAGCNAALLALHRGADEFHSRHWESVALLPVCIIALGTLRPADRLRWRHTLGRIVFVVTLSAYSLAYASLLWRESWPYIASASSHRAAALGHYRALLLSNRLAEEGALLNARLEVRDYTFFDDPIGRFSLHPSVTRNILINKPAALSLLSPDILPVRPQSVASLVTRGVINFGWIFCILGAGLAIRRVRVSFCPCLGSGHVGPPPNTGVS